MKTSKIDLIVGVVLIVLLLWSVFGVNKVEYKVELVTASSTEGLSEYLNRMGEEGWDLFSFADFTDGRQYLFKRP